MSTKSEVLDLLMRNRGSYLSGQQMADSLYVTRASVWKAIKALEKSGYEIEAVTNKGYRLKSAMHRIDTAYLSNELNKEYTNLEIIYHESLDSTNDEARRLAEGYDTDILVIADEQLKGRGRRGREFFSPKDSGLYMSLLTHRSTGISKLAPVTGIAAVAVAKAIDEVCYANRDTTLIKWVNDVFVGDRKVCGILTEAFTLMEDEALNYIIIGIGVNVFEPGEGFPKELRNTAGYVLDNKGNDSDGQLDTDGLKTRLAAAIVRNIKYYENNQDESIAIYRDKSCLIGNYVKINNFGAKSCRNNYAKVISIDDKYHLNIEYDDGSRDSLSSGEVSVVRY